MDKGKGVMSWEDEERQKKEAKEAELRGKQEAEEELLKARLSNIASYDGTTKDTEVALNLLSEEAEETQIEREKALELQKSLLEEFKREKELTTEKSKAQSKKKIDSNIKAMEEKKKYMNFLKSTGRYTGRQLGPMKLVNLADLYHREKKRVLDLEKKVMAERAQVMKIAKATGNKIFMPDGQEDTSKEVAAGSGVSTGKITQPVVTVTADTREEVIAAATSSKVVKKVEKKKESESPREERMDAKRRKLILDESEDEMDKVKTSKEVTAHDEEEQDEIDQGMIKFTAEGQPDITEVNQIIVHTEEALNVKPLRTHVPIVDWYGVVVDNSRLRLKLIRANDEVRFYSSPIKVMKDISRTDLVDLYEIGKTKFGKKDKKDQADRAFDFGEYFFEELKLMFNPELIDKQVKKFSHLLSWSLYDSCGIYSLVKDNTDIHYYLFEKEYEHGISTLRQMLETGLNAQPGSPLASHLMWKIMKQVGQHSIPKDKR